MTFRTFEMKLKRTKKMKKLIVAMTFIGIVSITSCKENEEKVVTKTEQTIEKIKKQAEVIQSIEGNLETASKTAADIPQFSTGELQEFAQNYADYFDKIAEAQKEKDKEKLEDLLSESLNWSKKAAKWTQEMTEEDAQKWIKWSSRLRSSISNEY